MSHQNISLCLHLFLCIFFKSAPCPEPHSCVFPFLPWPIWTAGHVPYKPFPVSPLGSNLPFLIWIVLSTLCPFDPLCRGSALCPLWASVRSPTSLLSPEWSSTAAFPLIPYVPRDPPLHPVPRLLVTGPHSLSYVSSLIPHSALSLPNTLSFPLWVPFLPRFTPEWSRTLWCRTNHRHHHNHHY